MRKETRTICYDETLRIEAYHFEGILQPFPNHFHEHYVIGFVEHGTRRMSCCNVEYRITEGSIVLFHPRENHACVQEDGGRFDYRGFHIPQCVMLDWMEEVTGSRTLPGFSQNVILDDELFCYLQSLHQLIVSGADIFQREEKLLLTLSLLTERYGQPFERSMPECREEIEAVCAFLQAHYTERICLDQLCTCAGLSKSTLLRAFTKAKGMTPYRYLESIRINKAKKLLEQDIPPIEAAIQVGFSDQSHFTNYFSQFIGLPPGAYRNTFRKKLPRADKEMKHDERHT